MLQQVDDVALGIIPNDSGAVKLIEKKRHIKSQHTKAHQVASEIVYEHFGSIDLKIAFELQILLFYSMHLCGSCLIWEWRGEHVLNRA
jgi:hypothetical protein